MTSFRIMIAVLSAALLAWFVIPSGDPHAVKLPMSNGDPTPIAKYLDRLSDEERDLAIGYIKRSRGDVVLPSMADPDEPLTARTVGEAIKLQRKWLETVAEMHEKAEAHKAERDKAYAPLREALAVTLVKRDVLPRSAVYLPPGTEAAEPSADEPKQAKPDDPEVLVCTFELKNNTERTITRVEASVQSRKTHPAANELGILDDCWIAESATIASNETKTVRCGNLQRPATAAEREFADMSTEDFYVQWEPRLIRFEDGSELRYDDPFSKPRAAAE